MLFRVHSDAIYFSASVGTRANGSPACMPARQRLKARPQTHSASRTPVGSEERQPEEGNQVHEGQGRLGQFESREVWDVGSVGLV